jgi:hypothetical protein
MRDGQVGFGAEPASTRKEAAMTPPRRAGAAVLLFLLLAAPTPAGAEERPATEKEKIEGLIKHVEGLKDAKFVRNDREYDAKTAAEFLRRKWRAEAARVKTAEDFIEKVASVSSTSGKPYMIRLKGGKEMKSGDYLRGQLRKMEKSPAGKVAVACEKRVGSLSLINPSAAPLSAAFPVGVASPPAPVLPPCALANPLLRTGSRALPTAAALLTPPRSPQH